MGRISQCQERGRPTMGDYRKDRRGRHFAGNKVRSASGAEPGTDRRQRRRRTADQERRLVAAKLADRRRNGD